MNLKEYADKLARAIALNPALGDLVVMSKTTETYYGEIEDEVFHEASDITLDRYIMEINSDGSLDQVDWVARAWADAEASGEYSAKYTHVRIEIDKERDTTNEEDE